MDTLFVGTLGGPSPPQGALCPPHGSNPTKSRQNTLWTFSPGVGFLSEYTSPVEVSPSLTSFGPRRGRERTVSTV